jgi:cobalt/nickel transport system ATP-binding protein
MVDATLDIEIAGLSFRYPDGTLALDGIDLAVPRAGRVALIGPNGAGKSTLMLHFNGLLHGQGTVRILGQELTDATLPGIRRQVGLVFQNPDDQLFMPTVFDEVAYAAVNAGYDEETVRTRVAEALATVAMSQYADKHPINLSIGQKKRIAIASVLVTENRILVLDEPSAGLDPAGRRDLISMLDSFSATLVVASHDLDLVDRLCPDAVVLKAGSVIRTGDTPDILADTEFLSSAGL